MSSYVLDSRSLPAAGALSRKRLVKQDSSGNWALCGAGEIAEAFIDTEVDATMAAATPGFVLPGYLLKLGMTTLLTASAAISAGDDVYTAASGKVNNAKTGFKVGVARQAATADGDVIEVELRPDYAVWFAQIAAPSTAIAGTAAETAYDATLAIPAGLLRAGSRGKIRAKIIASATTGAETLLFKVKINDGTNTVVLAASVAVDVVNGDQAVIDIEFWLPDATHIAANAMAGIGTASGSMAPTGVATSTFAPTEASTVSVTQTASSTGETSALQMLDIEIRR